MTEKRLNLEDQLASVMEREGTSVLSPDGVRFMNAPSIVDVGSGAARPRKRRRRASKTSYADRPAISSRSEERVRDHVADLDRVVVGFGVGATSRMRTVPIAIQFNEHERSSYVVSLRGLSFACERWNADERSHVSTSFTHGDLPVGSAPSISSIAALAGDLRADGWASSLSEQFTPSTFEAAYAASYGPLMQLASAVTSVADDAARWFRKATTSDAREEAVVTGADAGLTLPVRVIQPRLSFVRVTLGVSGLLLVATLPANAIRLTRSFEVRKASVVAAGSDAMGQVKLAASTPLPEGVDALRKASSRFREADEILSGTNALAVGLASIVPQTRASYRSARALAEIGAKSADAASLLANGLNRALTDAGRSPLERIGVMSAYAKGALPLLDDATAALAKVDANALPEDRRETTAELAGRLEGGRLAVREFVGLSDLLTGLFGKTEPRRYLIVFQNPSELRPTGGFMGSYAELVVSRGEITALSVPAGGTYDLQGQLVARVAPPEPLRLIADRWEFQDANWSPDFHVASDKLRFFWSKSGGPTVDGVIAVNATLVEKLLALTGPIDVPELGKTITAENFMLETQKAVELEYDRAENKPKKILGLLAPRLLEKLKALTQDRWLPLLATLSDALETKDVQVALSDPDEDALASRFGWGGRVKPTPGDALAVIGANIAGQKTDLSVEEQVVHLAEVKPNGSITDTVTLTRAHTGGKGELFRGVRNVSYLRFYVPRGSTLVDAEGFRAPSPSLFEPPRDDVVEDADEVEKGKTLTRHPSGLDVWDEGDRTVVGGWSMVDPGETVTMRITYRLPFTAFELRERLNAGPGDEREEGARAAYSLLLTSQSGKPNRTITTSVTLPEGWSSRWSRPEAVGRPESGLVSSTWDRDRVVASLYDVQAP
ncbi:hypothetical protein A3E39_00015 [Candidatus Uhrbacteria bacterium RIFCSPHIGHO2_12_FULL_60_25]|uniref:DUF4012 domain-containing protein n=1 Tax=Candidatus Uhrbacteria bacterium RIFCSPHIGHO2_12_FULL_60_25 TaxID=1802399 RepID=A0A1F7UMI5_9BACT|nr:MAG: hypothetical protein A3D73_02770 [Candidatus Uhrbacteria bacterium RIFCSPHIGHO2_02_FULL_60_44]OGL79496.1 MAG: hypothetical protein A3E39_00015 [Candidatus Uhrbacteria bacterium RIFCSPHIGHO2_12_FULL_60_25]